MGMGKTVLVVAVAAAAAALCCGLAMASAPAACDPAGLSACAGAILFGAPASLACCARLRAQQACLCQYARDPSYCGYVNTPNAQAVAAACGLPKPKCRG